MNLKNEPQHFLPDEEQWKLILKDIHRENVPIEIHRKNKGIAELYANHVPAQLYVKHSYDALKRSLQCYIEEFQAVCHKTLENNVKNFKMLEDHEMVIKLGLQEITEQLAFVNLRPISEVMHLLNNLVFRITMNFLNFVKSVKKSYLSNIERKRETKQNFTNLCPDCKTNREQGLLKDLKRKLKLNKTELLQFQDTEVSKNPDDNFKKTDRQKQADIINQFAKVKHQTKENLRLQEERQSAWMEQQKKSPKNDFFSQSNKVADDILMNEKETYIKQINDLLEGRQVKQTTDANAYSYLVRQLMEFPHLDKLHEETYAKQAEKITQKIQGELLENFMTTLSEPLRLVLRKVLSKRYMNESKPVAPVVVNQQVAVQKVETIDVEVQTTIIEFQQKLKSMEKELNKKMAELNSVRHVRDNIEKKYIQKYEEQRQNQKQLHQNYLTIKDLKQEIVYLEEEKLAQKQKYEKELQTQIETMKKREEKYLKAVSQDKAQNEKKLKQYKEMINQDVSKKIVKIKEENASADQRASIAKYETEVKIRAENTLNNQSVRTIQSRQGGEEQKIEQEGQLTSKKKLYRVSSHSKTNFLGVKPRRNKHALTMFDYTKQRIAEDELQRKQDTELEQSEYRENFQTEKTRKSAHFDEDQNDNDLDSDEEELNKFYDDIRNSQQKNQTQNVKYYHNSKAGSTRSIDMMIKFNKVNKRDHEDNYYRPQNFHFNEKTGELTYNNQKTQHFLDSKNVSSKSQHRIKRKTTNQFSVEANQNRTLGIETEKTSPNKHFSSRKFRKMPKQVQFSFIKKQRQDRQKTIGHMENINQRQKSRKNISFDQGQNVGQQTEYNARSSKKKMTLKSALKLKNITIQDDHLMLTVNRKKESKDKNNLKNSQKIGYKSTTEMKKYYNPTNTVNQIQTKSSHLSLEFSQDYESISNFMVRQEILQGQNIWRPEFEKKQYNVEQIKTIVEKQFQYLKLTGVLEQVQNLVVNQQKNIRQNLLSVAKKVVMTEQKTSNTNLKNKDPFLKSHETLKSIISRSMNKLNQPHEEFFDSKTKKKIKKLAEAYLTEISAVETFSNPTPQDLDLFGGKENAHKIEIQNFNQENSSLIVKNTLSQTQELKLIDYFEKLFDLNRQKYIMYTSFLKYPTSYLNGTISKITKQSGKNTATLGKNLSSDMELLKATLKKIMCIHEKEHQNKCIHLQKFLKKIGYYRYMVGV